MRLNRPAILLDIDGTLVDRATAELEAARRFVDFVPELRRIDPLMFLANWRRARTDRGSHLDGATDLATLRRTRMEATLRALAGPAVVSRSDELVALFARLKLESSRPFPDVGAVVELGKRFPVGVVTNGDATYQRSKLDVAGISLPLQVFVASMAVGSAKPNARPFLLAALGLGREPADCIHVGDSFDEDVEGARAAGMTGVLVDRKLRGQGRSCARIETLHDLPQMIATLVAHGDGA